MALKGLDIFKLTPKKNCKECGCPTCMAFSMKVASGAMKIEQCPHMSEDAIASLSEATAPPMKTIKVGAGDAEQTLGGETVLYRHEKTYVSKTRYAVSVCSCMEDAKIDEILAAIPAVDYVRIGERMYVEFVSISYGESAGVDKYVEVVKKAAALGRTLILNVKDEAAAKAALDACKDAKPILNGADASNFEAMSKLASEAGVVLGVTGSSIDELYDTVAKIEKLGNKNLVLDVGTSSIKDAFATAVQMRRAALKDQDRTFGYPSLVNVGVLASGDSHLQAALASLFTLKYGSIIVMEGMSYAQALPLYGLRQNVFTDPQKPMKVEPGVYPINGGDENSICLTTVDFALTYFVVSGELERSGVPCNLLISDAGGLSVLTAWAAGKLSSTSIAKFIQEEGIEDKIKNRTLVLPGKVAVLKGDVEAKLPGWDVIVGPTEAVQLVKFLKDMQ
ncbi:acetyl-CoA decarbonylase/synthase complex subunit gamma [Qiania dongpingensis]|uniref:Acetyl-CoA decarbonylase/synthase complex subunit gamma n=1 Tax=Qiania dongpingensis TaxID=2763669 RepID=A0A7G9G4Y7_9FIRM|nr:acetyl-CoA decarbonylase/synthase complex subunit gamma [Qiania dongpingensis]QNM05869.1 acetyl-CoA decarbonylase/synthase complex subunit gamma [Qiania dongpingensis]